MSKLIYKSLNKLLSSGYPGTLVVPWDYLFQKINLQEKFFFAYITNQIASKKVKPGGTGTSDQKNFF